MRSTVLLTLAVALAGCSGSSSDTGSGGSGAEPPAEARVRLFDELLTAHSPSTPSVSTASADGWLLLGEGGTLAFLRPDEPGGFEQALKRVQLSSLGVRPMDLLADPGLDLNDGPDEDDVVYLAGGRLGLWVLRVSDAPAPSDEDRAHRVDDSRDGDPAAQDSRRLCNNLERVELGGESYLLALFAAKDDNRLRVYDIETVRAVAGGLGAATAETGHEIAPLLEIAIGGNPGAGQQLQAGNDFPGLSFGLGSAVDVLSADEVDVYLAMGHAGIARVHLTSAMLDANPPTAPAPVWGPAFGTGTPQHAANDLLRDMRYRDIGWDGEPVEPPVRIDPPPCLDVAVQHDAHGHFLYVAAEQAGWLRYDVADRSAFAPDLAVDHHQFPDPELVLDPDDNALCRVTPGAEDPMFASRLAYLDTPAGPRLAVSSSSLPHPFALSSRTEGRLLDHTAGRFVGVLRDPVIEDIQSRHCWTILYDVEPLAGPAPPEVLPELGSWPYGAESLILRTDAAQPDVLLLDSAACGPTVAGGSATFQGALHVRFDLASGTHETVIRSPRHFFGRKCKMAGPSLGHPDVILTASNDGGLRSDGFLHVCDGKLENDFRCFPCDGGETQDTRNALGQIWNPDAQWIPQFQLAEPFSGIVAGQGPQHGQLGHTMRFDYMRIGNPDRDPCLSPASPDLIARWDFKQVPDSLDQQAQRFLWGEIDATYDAENESGIDTLFMGLSALGEGIAVIDRTVLDRYFGFHLPPPGSTGSDLIQFHALEHVGSVDEPAHLRHLLTHREYYPVLAAAPQPDRERFNFKARLMPWNGAPQLFRLPAPDPGSGDGARWILAAPSGSVTFPPDHPVVQTDGELHDFDEPPWAFEGQHPDWAPAPRYASANGKALVQFFDVTDPRAIPTDANGIALPLAEKEIIGPDEGGGAITVQVLQLGEGANLTTYLFVADFAGRVLVYDWDELEDPSGNGNQDRVFARYEVRESVTDHLPGGNVFNMLVDRFEDATSGQELFHVYVPVTRVGIEVLRFDPTATPAARLTPVDLIETPVDAQWVHLRTDHRGPQPTKTMVVTDQLGGIRIYGYGEEREVGP